MTRKTAQEIVDSFDVGGVIETREWITSASVAELVGFCHKAGHHVKFCTMVDLARAELALKTAEASERVHWTITPGFIVGVLAMLFAALAAWPTVREWFQSVPPAHTNASSQSPRSDSVPVILPAPKTAAH